MHGVTLFAVGLVGAGVAVIAAVLYGLARRYRIVRNRPEARRPSPASVPRPASAPRPGPRPASGVTGRPPARRPAPVRSGAAGRGGPGAIAREETVLLHEVPAWSTPTTAPASAPTTRTTKPAGTSQDRWRNLPDRTGNVRRDYPSH